MPAHVRAGLTATPKELARCAASRPQRVQHVADGPTSAEHGLLADHASAIADLTKARTLVELGSGSSEKTHLLLHALHAAGSLERHMPVE